MSIRHYKRQARLRAHAKGTSLQSELNAIAREEGHAAWGNFQAALKARAPVKLTARDFLRNNDKAIEIEAIADAYEVARQEGAHLVVLRSDPALEKKAIGLVIDNTDEIIAARFEGAMFVDELTDENIAAANVAGRTLIAGSGDMPRNTSHGNFVVNAPDRHLWSGRNIVSKRDQAMLYGTTAVKYLIPTDNRDTIERTMDGIRSTTIRRQSARRMRDLEAISTPSTLFHSVDDGMAIAVEWDASKNDPDADIIDYPFMPAFNVLGPKFLPDDANARHAHLERIAHILLPDRPGGNTYFDKKGRAAIVGFITVEIGRAAREDRAPSIPALIDWIIEGQVRAGEVASLARQSGKDQQARDPLSQWLSNIVTEAKDNGYGQAATVEITPLVDMAPNERSGVLGTMDKGFLPFKNRHIRARTS